MMRLKRLLNKIKFNSIYLRWILLFMVLIMLAYFVTFLLISRQVMPEIKNGFKEQMEKKAEFIQLLSENGYEITEETLSNTGDNNINTIIFSEDDLSAIGAYENEISLGMLVEASRGSILTFDSQENFVFCLFQAGGRYIILEPNVIENEIDTIAAALVYLARTSAFIAAVFIVIAVIFITRPIKKVISASAKVSQGNFDIQIPERPGGDIGLLIRNFNKMVKSLYNNEYLKKDFVSNVSHEFKTPITSIEGFARLLQNEDITKEELREYTGIIIKESARLSNMSANLLKLTELDGREFAPERNAYYLDEQIRGILLLLENIWGPKDITFDLNMDEMLIVENEELLHQVWLNLLHNAIKFSYHGAVITITGERDASWIRVSIEDYGPGMTLKQTQHIFERFYQADESHSSEGSGLGLAIVKRIVEMLNGTVECISAPGKGTVFTVCLPVAEQGGKSTANAIEPSTVLRIAER